MFCLIVSHTDVSRYDLLIAAAYQILGLMAVFLMIRIALTAAILLCYIRGKA
jgi:hypothetical protein